jgi:hypothetical protein
LQFCEQPHVLNRDDRLVGEGLQERDLRIGEGLHLGPSKVDCADGHALAQERNAKHGSGADLPGDLAAYRELLGLRLQIGHVDRPSVEDRTSADRIASGSKDFAVGRRRDRAVVCRAS